MATVPLKSPAAESLKQRFQRLATEWDDATAHLSSMSASSEHPAYQEIIRMGPDVLPLLLRDLEETENDWFYALSAITGAHPIPESSAGNIPKMVQAWLDWAKEHGYRW